jgi:hypothetical protein
MNRMGSSTRQSLNEPNTNRSPKSGIWIQFLLHTKNRIACCACCFKQKGKEECGRALLEKTNSELLQRVQELIECFTLNPVEAPLSVCLQCRTRIIASFLPNVAVRLTAKSKQNIFTQTHRTSRNQLCDPQSCNACLHHKRHKFYQQSDPNVRFSVGVNKVEPTSRHEVQERVSSSLLTYYQCKAPWVQQELSVEDQMICAPAQRLVKLKSQHHLRKQA